MWWIRRHEWNNLIAGVNLIARKLDLLLEKEAKLMTQLTDALDRAEAAAKANSDADDAAENLVKSLAEIVASLKAAGTDPATITRIDTLTAALNARAAQLGAAVVAGTPAA